MNSVLAWRPALRLAWRDALAHRLRSALVLVLIGLPVLVVGIVDIGYRTYQLSPEQTVTRAIGTADLGVRWSGLDGHLVPDPAAWLDGADSSGTPTAHEPTTAELAALLPAHTRLIAWRVGLNPITFRTAHGLDAAQLVGLDLADPLTRGIARIVAGHAPHTGEVALTRSLAAATGLRIGGSLVTGTRRYRITGLVADGSERTARAVYTLPSAVTVHADDVSVGMATYGWLARTPVPISWAVVTRLAAHGYAGLSRQQYLHPSPAARHAAASIAALEGGASDAAAVLALVVGMAVLEVVLLAGPAFAVGAKRRRRDLGLIAAAGGSARELRRVVLASALVLGTVAGVIGATGAALAATLGAPLFERHVDQLPGTLDVPVPDLVGLVLIATLTAVLASVVPARVAARTDVVAALAGRRGDVQIRRSTPVAGLVLAAIGVLLSTLLGADSVGNNSAVIILGGIALVELGLILCMPAVLTVLARLGRRLPLSARLALRDAGRNRSAAAPAVAAVMAAVIGATAALLGLSSQADRDRRHYQPTLPNLAVSAPVDAASADAVRAAIAHTLPVSSVLVVHGAPAASNQDTGRYRVLSPATSGDSAPTEITQTIVATPGEVTALYGGPRPGVSTALAKGEAVVADAGQVRDATVRLTVSEQVYRIDSSASRNLRTVRVRAVAAPHGYRPADLIIPPALAARYHVTAAPIAVFAREYRAPSDDEVARAQAAVRAITPTGSGLYVERGYRDPYATLELAFVLAAATVAVLGAVIATLLANVDGRADLLVLGAVGAAPRIRRRLAASRAAVVAGIGTLAGVLAGMLVPYALVLQSRSASGSAGWLHFVVPWPPLLLLAAAVPGCAALISAALTRSRLPGGSIG